MKFHHLLLLSIFAVTSGFAYNPYKDKKVRVFIEQGCVATGQEIFWLSEEIDSIYSGKCGPLRIVKGTPSWFEQYHLTYRSGSVTEMPAQAKDTADVIVVVKYMHEIVYGLSGDMAFSGWVGGGSTYSTNSGAATTTGYWGALNITDENPEWQYHTTISFDVYDCVRHCRMLTLVQTEEASSDDPYEIQTIKENITEIMDDIGDELFSRSAYSNYDRLERQKRSVRSTSEVNEKIRASLINLFDEAQTLHFNDTISVPLRIDERGVVTLISDTAVSKMPAFGEMLKHLSLQRVAKSKDSAACNLSFVLSEVLGRTLVNGYYCRIIGQRDKNEVWKILYRYVDEYVRHHNMAYSNSRSVKVGFTITADGTTSGVSVFGRTKDMESIERDFVEEISEWNFGSRQGASSGTADVEFVCTFSTATWWFIRALYREWGLPLKYF